MKNHPNLRSTIPFIHSDIYIFALYTVFIVIKDQRFHQGDSIGRLGFDVKLHSIINIYTFILNFSLILICNFTQVSYFESTFEI